MSYETARVIVWFAAIAAIMILSRLLVDKIVEKCSDTVIFRMVCGAAIALAVGIGFTIAHAVYVYATGGES